jgi:hypothetical protein
MIELLLSVLLFLSVLCNLFLLIALKRSFTQIDTLEDWLINFKKDVVTTYNKLKEIDDRGIFEKDDDVGFLFDDLKKTIGSLNQKVNEEENDSV